MMSRNQEGEERMSNSVEWLIEKCACADLRPEIWDIIKQQAMEMHKKETIAFALHYTFGHQEVSDQIKSNIEKLYTDAYNTKE